MPPPAPTPDAPPSYTIAALAKAAGVTVRTARFYFAEGIVQRPVPRGPATRYTEDQLLRVRAVKKLRFEGMRLPEIKRRLPSMALDELRALVDPPSAPPVPTAPSLAADLSMERWDHATLLPGLELRVRSDAGPLVQRIAREIVAAYRAK